ncbi:hypothetical protein WM16_13185 [Burkholderia ubonensis]|uniref:Uncharacterized protein n=1 Tax=Burkholderia ubonensis TaxID=101571 RepID=A0A108CJZ9_9BURK|nr:hypothetical protein [Burkholderia ubonensis]KWK75858.1 hypothetical protein WM16_13185 [Burkholderia ubonensis]
MKNLFHALWHPFLHFRALRWFARRGRWLLVMVPLAFALHAGLDLLGHPVAANVVFDLLVVRLMIVVFTRFTLVPSYPSNIAQTKPPLWSDPNTGANSGEWSPGSIRVN